MKILRHKLFIVSVTIILTTLFGKSDAWAFLQIYKIKGEVTVRSGLKEVNAKRRATVKPSDILCIPQGGSIDILDSDNRRIYSSTKTGRMSVKSLMKKAESQAANITKNINKKVISAVADNAGKKRTGYDSMGMVIHETDAVVPALVNIPEGMSYLSYLLSDPIDPDSLHQSFISLAQHMIDDEDDATSDNAFNFMLHNSTTRPLFFNIIAADKENDLKFLFRRNPLATPKSDTIIEEYTFLPDTSTQKYIAIASDHNFSLDDVRHLLDDDYIPKDNYYMTILTIDN